MTLKYQIGVDAGGTHTIAIAYDTAGQELEQIETGPGQLNTDYEDAINNITTAINQLLNQIDGDCQRVLCGMAGLSVIGNAPQVAAEISSKIGNLPTRAVTDSLLALYNGLKGEDGGLVIAGTGSVFNGLQKGHIITTGGYGAVLGDEGSGYAITLAALKAALLSWDKREENALIQLFNQLFDVENLVDATAKFYQMSNPEVASMAVDVAKLADQGNPAATAVIKQQAQLLARDIIIGMDRYEDPKPMTVALTGSVLANNQMLRNFLENEVWKKYPKAKFTVSNGENARGVIYDKSNDYRHFTS
ncbi:BadF/BadG/BcrA/BcrD ATPase family protein [Lactobacillus sp. ESL0681]|uniref:N-acetylglucosamine kinase n=1 Tax=Lactobacillus sp. ESL0681 TaxID=2983211 RepID=UPI0023FA1F40|nr:BadF/BadG/BcrA/BcrD ATPase family protein [Lactobacillus sp. ESL0681]WEV40916.1 N-acetylglucosamine kinase [Lactobacillus sp. ESL0681]